MYSIRADPRFAESSDGGGVGGGGGEKKRARALSNAFVDTTSRHRHRRYCSWCNDAKTHPPPPPLPLPQSINVLFVNREFILSAFRHVTGRAPSIHTDEKLADQRNRD